MFFIGLSGRATNVTITTKLPAINGGFLVHAETATIACMEVNMASKLMMMLPKNIGEIFAAWNHQRICAKV